MGACGNKHNTGEFATGCGGPLFFTEAHDSGKGRIILPNSGSMNTHAAFFCCLEFF